MVDKITFDGTNFRIIEDDEIVFEIPAISGKLGNQIPANANQVNVGTIPAGTYLVKQSRYQDISDTGNLNYLWGKTFLGGQWPGAEFSWGNERVWLEPQSGTNTYGRNNFSIHGGTTPGSAGCIDLVDDAQWFFNYFLNSDKDWTLEVNYGTYDGSTHPFYGDYEEHEIKTYDYDVPEAIEEQGGAVSFGEVATSTGSGGETVSISKTSATTDIGGETYLITDIADSIAKAAHEVGTFINQVIQDGIAWFTNGGAGSIQIDVGNWLANNLGNVIDGNLDVDEAFIDLAEYIGTQRIAGFVSGQIAYVSQARAVLADAFLDAGAQGDAWKYADSVYSALTKMAVDFALNSEGWDAEQYTKAGLTTIASVIAYDYGAQFFSSAGLNPAGAAAAATTIVAGLLDSGDYGQSEWVLLGVQAGIAYGASVAGAAIAEAIIGASLASGNPAVIATAIVIAAIISLTGAKVVSNLYKGQVFYNGEFGDPSLVLNSIYQVQQIEVNGQQVDALVATNSQGSTVIASGNIGHILGGSGEDVLVGDGNVQTISGNAGSDYLEGKDGNDNLLGGAGNDLLNGGEGEDILQGDAGDDQIFGENGADIIIAGSGNDFAHGGSNDDIISGGDNNDMILAASGDDSISGDTGNDTLDGGHGDDSIAGGTGDDLILGNLGNDAINGDDDSDTIFGDDGNDTIYGGNGNDFIDGGNGSDILNGDNGDDLIVAGSDDNSDDFADGGLGNDNILSGGGNDALLGGMDNDYLSGQDGDDTLEGGFGNDILIGGIGENILNGADGNDVYVISDDLDEHDNLISDSDGTDTILLSWLTQTNAQNDLVLEQDGDDLKITYDGRLLTTITDHFIAGTEIEKIELSDGKYIDLSAVTYNSTTHIGTFSVGTLSSGSVVGDVGSREDFIDAAMVTKQVYWNDTFLDKLSQIAYDEQLGDELSNTYYNGTEVEAFFRKRSIFGGKYTVYKLSQPGNIDGTDTISTYTVIPTGGSTSGYNSIINNARKVTMDWDSGAYHYNVVDFWNSSTFLSSTVTITNIGTSDVVFQQNLAQGEDYWVIDPSNQQLVAWNANDRFNNITYTTVNLGVSNALSGDDLLVGSYWNETITGKSGDDVLVGNSGSDVLHGGDGNDWLFGGEGADALNGNNGADVLFGGGGDDNLNGGASDDALLGGEGIDTVSGDNGNDWIDGGAGNDFLYGGAGNDILAGDEGADTLNGDDGNDILHGDNGDDFLNGGAGDDILYGGAGVDALDGGGGNDILYGGGGTSTLNGGDGIDKISFQYASSGMTLNLSDILNPAGSSTGDTLISIEGVVGTIYNDTINGLSSQANYISSGGGNDTINGGSLADILDGEAGTDTINGNDGDDLLNGGSGADVLNGGNGNDTVNYASSSNGVTINLNTGSYSGGDATGDTYNSIEYIIGSLLVDYLTGKTTADQLWGNSGDDFIYGLAGNDILYGDDGLDSIYGGADNDTIYGGAGGDFLSGDAGADALDGGDGADYAYYLAATAAVTVNLQTPTSNTGEATGDTYTSIEALIGSNYNDSLTGYTSSINYLYGFDGADTIAGGSVADYLYGGNGNDTINGNDGADTIEAGAGADTLNGGNDIDNVSYAGSTAAVNINIATNVVSGGDAAGDVISNFENIGGSSYNDTLTGNSSDNYIWGGAGNDTLSAGAGSDTLYGEAGSDTINGGDGNDFLYGADGNDNINGDNNDDTIEGGAGSDTLNGGAGSDIIVYMLSSAAVNINIGTNVVSGGDAAGDIISNFENIGGSVYGDTLTGSSSNNYIYANAGNDFIYGLAGNDILYGDDGLDSIYGGADNDTIYGGAGGDFLSGDAGADALDGGDGYDYAYYLAATAAVTVNLQTAGSNTGDAAGDTYTSIEGVFGSNYNDTITGYTSSSAQLYGYDGNDTINGGNMADYIWGGNGTDTINGNDGDDTLEGGAGADTINGGNGTDTVSYGGSTAAVNVNIATNVVSGGDAAGDTISNFENISGSAYADTLTGNSSNNILWGGAGNDTISAATGSDTAYGEDGADTINGGDGNDFLYGNAGNDNINGDNNDDTIEGGAGADTLNGGADTDTLVYILSSAAVNVNIATNVVSGGDAAGDTISNFENIQGSNYNDILTGNSVTNFIYGASGDDTIDAGDGNDTVYGEFGNDTLLAGSGVDTFYGGADSDIFIFDSITDSTTSGRDSIMDFASDVDLISISTSIANSFTDLIIAVSGTGVNVTDSDSSFSFYVEGVSTLSSSDFVFS